jgi:mRNA interferase MazF
MLGLFQNNDSWVKGDMLYTVGFHRLDRVRLGKRHSDGKRKYFDNKLGKDQMKLIYQCVMHGLNLGKLAAYL